MQDRTSANSMKVLLQRAAGPYMGSEAVRLRTSKCFPVCPQSGHRELASMCPLGAVKALRAAALHDGAGARMPDASDLWRGFDRTSEIVQPSRTRAAGDGGWRRIAKRANAASSARASMDVRRG